MIETVRVSCKIDCKYEPKGMDDEFGSAQKSCVWEELRKASFNSLAWRISVQGFLLDFLSVWLGFLHRFIAVIGGE